MSAESGDDAEDHERQSTDVPPEDSADNFCGLQPDERNQSTLVACEVPIARKRSGDQFDLHPSRARWNA